MLIWLLGLGDYEIENSEVIEDPVPVVELKVHEDKNAKKDTGAEGDNVNAEESEEDSSDEGEDE